MGRAAERDDVPDLHLRRVDEDAVDQQLGQFSPAREGGLVEPLGDTCPECLDAGGQRGGQRLLLRAGRELLLLPGEVGEPGVERPPADLQLLQGNRRRRVRVD
jgi:hypothetical protein